MDVHKETISEAVAEDGRTGEVRSPGTFSNDLHMLEKRMRQHQQAGYKLRVCYEAGPCGFGIARRLRQLGIDSQVIAPSLIPKKSGDRRKNDQRDAVKLARCHRAGELTTVHIPEPTDEALRDLCRARTDILGSDLTQVPGLQTISVSTFLSEVGPTVERFPTPKHFASWLGLCPDNRITGGKILSAATRDVKSRTAEAAAHGTGGGRCLSGEKNALRMASQSLQRSHSALGDYFRRMKARLGAPEAITEAAAHGTNGGRCLLGEQATAHKLARILHHLIKHRVPHDASVFAKEEELHRQRKERVLRKQAAFFGYQLTPLLE